SKITNQLQSPSQELGRIRSSDFRHVGGRVLRATVAALAARANILNNNAVKISTPRVNPNVSIPKVNVSTPQVKISTPKVNVPTPKVNVSTPKVNVSLVTPRVSAPQITVKVPTIRVPTVRVPTIR